MDETRNFQETQSSAPRGVTGSATAPQGRCRGLLLPQIGGSVVRDMALVPSKMWQTANSC